MGRQRGNGEVAAVDAGEALRDSKARYRAVVQPSADGIGLMDAATLHLLEANPAFFELLGYTEEELPELTVYDIVAHDPLRSSAHGWKRASCRWIRWRRSASSPPASPTTSTTSWRSAAPLMPERKT